jgi:hypothetical protein
LTEKFSFQKFKKDLVAELRNKEAEMCRGNLTRLEQLDSTTDAYLLKKWTWTSAVVGAIVSFFVSPLILGVLTPILPRLMSEFLWSVVKVCMGMSLLMFCAAIYFTIVRSSD